MFAGADGLRVVSGVAPDVDVPPPRGDAPELSAGGANEGPGKPDAAPPAGVLELGGADCGPVCPLLCDEKSVEPGGDLVADDGVSVARLEPIPRAAPSADAAWPPSWSPAENGSPMMENPPPAAMPVDVALQSASTGDDCSGRTFSRSRNQSIKVVEARPSRLRRSGDTADNAGSSCRNADRRFSKSKVLLTADEPNTSRSAPSAFRYASAPTP